VRQNCCAEFCTEVEIVVWWWAKTTNPKLRKNKTVHTKTLNLKTRFVVIANDKVYDIAEMVSVHCLEK